MKRTWVGAMGIAVFAAAAALGACDSGTADDGPPPPEACCGCLCKDPTWSCSKETCLGADGTATALVPEAGMFELAGSDYVSYKGAGQTPRARVWYSFQPAESDPANKPLVILFQGVTGPTLGLLGYGTGHFTFDSKWTNGADFIENPDRWTDFANLLYIDEPGAGWSYQLARADGSTPPVKYDAYAQAGEFLRVVLRFVARHPQIGKAPIVIAGESGGGLKSVYMTKIMLDYPTLVDGGTYQDAELHDEIVAFLGARRPELDPKAWTPADIAGVFTHQIFIEPYLTHYQWDDLMTLDPATIPGCVPVPSPPDPDLSPDALDCSETAAEATAVFEHLAHVGTDPDLLGQVLRCDVKSIEWLHADKRAGEYARTEGGMFSIDQTKLVETFGPLEAGASYYILRNQDTNVTWDLGPGPSSNVEHGVVSLRSLHEIPTFITRAAYDLRYNAQFLPKALAHYTDDVTSVTYDATQPASAKRPGQIVIEYSASAPFGGGTVVIPNPSYAAGHSVTHDTPAELKEDIQAFLSAP